MGLGLDLCDGCLAAALVVGFPKTRMKVYTQYDVRLLSSTAETSTAIAWPRLLQAACGCE